MQTLKDLINENKTSFFIKSNIDKTEIENAEKELQIKFDDSYIDYLLSFGAITYESMETYGVGMKVNSYLHVVKATKELISQNSTFPANSVVLEYIGENNFVIYSMNKGVFHWSSNKLELIKLSLEEYLLMRINEEGN